jgi:hypothetical protein
MLKTNEANPLPSFFVGKQVTKDRIDRFIAEKHPLLSGAIGTPDTKAIWYSKDHVAQWLAEMDKAGADGMRIYFGMQGAEDEYPNQTCLLMVMTRADMQTGVHTDFTIEDSPDFADRRFRPGNREGNRRDFNTGSPCPPVCDAGMAFGR